MANKGLYRFSTIILPLLTAVATVILFFVFAPQEGVNTLFYTNLCFSVLLELVFFGWIGFLRIDKKATSAPFSAALGIIALFYVIIGLIWMFVYTFLLTDLCSIKVYISVIVIITLLWIIVATLLAHSDVDHKEFTNDLNIKKVSINGCIEKMKQLNLNYQNVCEAKKIKFAEIGNDTTPMDKLLRCFKSLTPNIFSNEFAMSQIVQICEKCNALIEKTEISDETDKDFLMKEMNSLVNDSVSQIQFLKNTTKR